MIRLKSISPFRSIPAFEEIELPNLAILVGLNGSGKSHLLQAIAGGNVMVAADDAAFPMQGRPPMPSPRRGVVLLKNGDPSPQIFSEEVMSRIAGQATGQPQTGWQAMPDPAVSGFSGSRETTLTECALELQREIEAPLAAIDFGDADMWSAGPERFFELASAIDTSITLDFVVHRFKSAEQRLLSIPGLTAKLRFAAQRLGVSVLQITTADLQANAPWTDVAAFDPPVVQFFARYRDLRIENDLRVMADTRNGTDNGLSDDDFIIKHGEPPWKLISDALAAFDLPYRVEEPNSLPSVPCRLALRRTDNGANVDIEGLSSGERVLLRLAISLFDFDQIAVSVTTPDFLLLDEMDASLHPEMVQRWLHGLQRGVVGKLGTKVILTTHSSTTVALGPEEAIFQMSYGEPGPRKVTKQHALNALTFGLPTLSIDYSGRRQVFVESDTDAAAYDVLASAMKGRLDLPRTLTFISTGVRENNVEQNTGCQIVRRLVTELSENGTQSIYGVLDWDGGANISDERIYVVGEGSHYAFDNVILDPLLIGALLLREDRAPEGVSMTFAELGSSDAGQLQSLADAVIAAVALEDAEDRRSAISVYFGGATIELPDQWNVIRGHDLEDRVVEKFPVLKKWHGKGRGKLAEAVARLVVRDYPDLCPRPIKDLLVALAS